MGQVHDINEARPHVAGEFRCNRCNHSWTAVAPVTKCGVEPLECPECGYEQGMAHGYTPPQDSYIFQCQCEATQFFLTEDYLAFCFNCGAQHDIDDVFSIVNGD